MRLKTAEKQELLESADVEDRLRRLTGILSRELESFELGAKIQSQVESEMDKSQREYYLRQQLKAIQKELGESEPEQAEVEPSCAERVDEAEPARGGRPGRPSASSTGSSASRRRRRVRRHPHLPRLARDAAVGTRRTEDDLDLRARQQVLDEDHYDLEKVKERILEYLAVLAS